MYRCDHSSCWFLTECSGRTVITIISRTHTRSDELRTCFPFLDGLFLPFSTRLSRSIPTTSILPNPPPLANDAFPLTGERFSPVKSSLVKVLTGLPLRFFVTPPPIAATAAALSNVPFFAPDLWIVSRRESDLTGELLSETELSDDASEQNGPRDGD